MFYGELRSLSGGKDVHSVYEDSRHIIAARVILSTCWRAIRTSTHPWNEHKYFTLSPSLLSIGPLLFVSILTILLHPHPARSCKPDDIVRSSAWWSDTVLLAPLDHHYVTALAHRASRLATSICPALTPWSTLVFRWISTFGTPFPRDKCPTSNTHRFLFYYHIMETIKKFSYLKLTVKLSVREKTTTKSCFILYLVFSLPYKLFSQTYTQGNFHSLAILKASNSCPWFAAPSPYNAKFTPPSSLYLWANATPVPSGT